MFWKADGEVSVMPAIYDYSAPKAHGRNLRGRIRRILERSPEVSFGVLYNRTRSRRRSDVDEAVADLVAEGAARVEVRENKERGIAFKWLVSVSK